MKTVLLLLLPTVLVHVAFSQSYMFYFVPESKSWSDAQAYCRQHYMDLATFTIHVDVEEALRVIHKNYTENVWVGLYRHGPNDPWFWSDQSGYTFIPWGPNQPNNWENNQYCVEMKRDGTLNDLACATKLGFVCYTERIKQTARLAVKSSQNLNDPAMKTDILQQIEQIMKEKGMVNYAKLTWKIQSDGNVFQKEPAE